MDRWTKLTEFFACGLFVLPTTLGVGLDDFEIFAATLGLMQLLLIAVTLAAPTVFSTSDKPGERPPRR